MRTFIIALIVLWSIPALAFFTSFSVNGSGGVAPTCDGTINLAAGCPQPMLGVM